MARWGIVTSGYYKINTESGLMLFPAWLRLTPTRAQGERQVGRQAERQAQKETGGKESKTARREDREKRKQKGRVRRK